MPKSPNCANRGGVGHIEACSGPQHDSNLDLVLIGNNTVLGCEHCPWNKSIGRWAATCVCVVVAAAAAVAFAVAVVVVPSTYINMHYYFYYSYNY